MSSADTRRSDRKARACRRGPQWPRAFRPRLEGLEDRVTPVYTATLTDTTAQFTGDAAGDTLIFTESGGFLQHNRFTAGDPGFESDLDFDSTVAGVQTLAADPTAVVNVDAGDGDDTIALGDGVAIGGVVDGGGGTNTIDYSAYTTPVAVNLGLGTPGLTATLGADQENPPTNSTATGTAAVSNYDPVAKTFDITITVDGIPVADVIGFHIHRGAVGVNGPIVIDFAPGGVPIAPLVPTATGFTFTATGVSLAGSLLGGPANEAAFLGGITYVNVHTPAAPGGLIRGQLFSTGNVNLAATGGTATGTSGILNVQNVIGGAGADSLVGSFAANTLAGGDGNDTIVGGPGSDTMQGDAGQDVMVWSNGDGTDVIDGGAEADTVQVNGRLDPATPDVFTIAAGAGGRIAFDRAAPGPFALDIGTVETLTVNGIAGDDTFTVNSLAGVADLATVRLNGFDGTDTFTVTPTAGVEFSVTGGPPAAAPGDALTVATAGTANPTLSITSAVGDTRSGSWTFGDRGPVSFAGIETLTPTADLAVTLADAPDPVLTGTNLTYTVTLTNTGPADAGAVQLTVVPPANTTFVSFTAPAGWTATTPGAGGTGAVTVTAPTLTAGAAPTFTLVVRVTPAAAGTTLTATATVTSSADPNPANDSATATTAVRVPGVLVGVPNFAAGRDRGGSPTVRYFRPDGTEQYTLTPFDESFTGGVRVAVADFNGDGIPDVAVGTGPGVATQVRVFDGKTRAELFSVAPFEASFLGGVYVAAGDIDGDGRAELIITPDEGGGPRVRVFHGGDFALLADFFGIDDPNFRGGARAAAADITGDGRADLIVAAGFQGGPRVAFYDANSIGGGRTPAKLFNDIFVFEETLRNGVFVAGGDVNGDGFADLIAGGGPGGGPRVLTLSGRDLVSGNLANPTALTNFFAGNPDNRGGIRVAAKDLDGDLRADLVVGDGTGAGSRVTGYLGATFAGGTAPEEFAFDTFPGFTGGVFVG